MRRIATKELTKKDRRTGGFFTRRTAKQQGAQGISPHPPREHGPPSPEGEDFEREKRQPIGCLFGFCDMDYTCSLAFF